MYLVFQNIWCCICCHVYCVYYPITVWHNLLFFFLYFNQGGDLIKWDKAKISYYVGIDIAEGSVSGYPLNCMFKLCFGAKSTYASLLLIMCKRFWCHIKYHIAGCGLQEDMDNLLYCALPILFPIL